MDMKQFIRKLTSFLLISAMVLLILGIIPRYIIAKKSTFKLKGDYSMAIFGHSHPECAYNDSIIKGFKNLAESGESYFYTYQKIKKVISDNPRINTVFIEFSNNQINAEMDNWIWGYDKMNFRLPTYSPFMDKDDFLLLYKNNSMELLACTSIATKKNLFKILRSDYNYVDNIGGFTWLDVNELQNSNYMQNIDLESISQANLDYLRKIIDYCRERNVEVFLTRSPTHKNFIILKNEPLFQKTRIEQFRDVEFLDFKNFNVPDDYFADFDHLNYKGAKVFSQFISTLLKNGLLKSENKEKLILESIEKIGGLYSNN